MEYYSAVWCSAADTHLKLLDHVVSGAIFLTGGVFDCKMTRPRYVAVLCMPYSAYRSGVTRFTLFMVLYLCRATRGALVSHRYTHASRRCRISQYRSTFILLSVSLWIDLADSVLDDVILAGFKSGAIAFLLATAVRFRFVSYRFPSLFFYWFSLWGGGLRTDSV